LEKVLKMSPITLKMSPILPDPVPDPFICVS
jgi:hypothetical protein